jgi:predicted transglutaminase-like cysteine proteinase
MLRCHNVFLALQPCARIVDVVQEARSAVMQFAVRCAALGILCYVIAQPAHSASTIQNILPPFGHTVFCTRYPQDCASTPKRSLSSVEVSTRWRELTVVQAWVNAAISPRDARPGQFDAWLLFPLEGNCNDYAVTKRHVLLDIGWPASMLLLAEVRLVATGEHHLVLVVRDSTGDWVLDNLRPQVVRLEATRDDYRLQRIESAKNPKSWTRILARRD